MVKRVLKKKKKPSFWRSKEVKRVAWFLGIPIVVLMAWYAYQVTYEFNKASMKKMEASVKKGISEMAERAMKEGFKAEDVDKCKKMVEEYTTPKGWFYSDAALYQLVGLSKKATQAQMNERCVYYAKAVAKMEKQSHHTRHVFVCGKSNLDVGGDGRFYIKPDPQRRGALQNFDPNNSKLINIPHGESTVLLNWQIHNVGDGCIIVGLSKAGTFRMSGTVVHKK
jgi:hypothetical protein